MVDNVLIMAGGSGTRLWPASTQERPKQFLDLGIGTSLLAATLQRAYATGAKNQIAVITHASQVPAVEAELAALGYEDALVIGEPIGRNTAPAIACGLWTFDVPGGAADQTTLVLAADHLITPTEAFVEDVEKADLLAREGFMVTFGIPPTRPETGYGYIEQGDAQGPGNLVASFREKPDEATAEGYLQAGRYLWNSGMFVFHHQAFWQQLSEYAPELTAPFESAPLPESTTTSVNGSGTTSETIAANRALYDELPSVSIDYALMEHTDRAAVVPVSFTWNDIGSWDEVATLQAAGHLGTESGEVPVVQADAAGNYVLADQPVALCGVEDLIVVAKEGRLLICRKGRSQLVKQIVEALKADGREDLL